MLDSALRLAAEYRVLPVRPGGKKPPLVKGGCHAATQDPATIHRWWTWHPHANIAAATGDGFAVVDVDPRHDGTLEAVAALGLPLHTRTVRTPSGGWQLHYAVTEAVKSRSGALAPGLDTRGTGGYVLLPPSRRADGEYTWESAPDAPILTVDAAVLNRVNTHHGGAGQSLVGGRLRPEEVQPGQRNSQLCLWAGWWAWTCDDLYEVESLLWQFNERMPDPLPDEEIQAIVNWITHKALAELAA